MNNSGLVSALLIADKVSQLDWDSVNNLRPAAGLLWMHFDYKEESARSWIKNESHLDEQVIDALLAQDTRPRFFLHGQGLLVIVRGVNLNPGAEPDDMVSLRVWIEPGRILSMRHRRVKAVEDLRETLLQGKGPRSESEFLAELTKTITLRMSESLHNLSERVDELEEMVLEENSKPVRTVISELRRQIIGLRRYLAPQQEVFTDLQSQDIEWMEPQAQASLRETSDRLTRYVEDLDAARERTVVTQDELENQMASRTNKTIYLLSIITAIFLPLGLLTGLLGINVGGIPGAENPYAFAIVCSLLVGIVIMQVVIFRRIRWV